MSKKLLEQGQRDVRAILKLATLIAPAAKEARNNRLKQMFYPLLMGLGGVAAAGTSGWYFAKKDKERNQEDIKNSMKSLVSKNPSLIKNPAQFVERFQELAIISPTIAKNPSLASKLMEKKLNTGFTVDDIHKLTAIERNASSARRFDPGAAGRASAGHAVSTLIGAFGKDYLEQQREHDKLYKAQMSAIQAANDAALQKVQEMDQKISLGSAQRVSDECLGQMLAERYVMIKTAGLGDAFSAGVANMGKGLSYFAPALALGGGIELVRHVLEARRTAALEEQADANFKHLARTSDKIKGNMEGAKDAFATLKAIAPSLAARPMVARTFIEFVAENDRLPPETIMQLAQTENEVRGMKSKGKSTLFGELKTTMGIMGPKQIGDIEKAEFGRGKITKSSI